jgi:hypothetical protein
MKKPKILRFKRMTPFFKILTLCLGAIQLGLLIAALIDLEKRPSKQIKGNKLWWRLGAFVNYLGPLAYFFFGRKKTGLEKKEETTAEAYEYSEAAA